MAHSLSEEQMQQLQECLALAHDLETHADADRRFGDLVKALSADPATMMMLKTLWQEVLAARRSSLYWQQISDVERLMTEKLADNHFQLQQNYLRLMQEQ